MAKVCLLMLLIVITLNLQLSATSTIDCKYKTGDWMVVKNSYFCEVTNDPKITTRESAAEASVSGDHENENINSNVEGFSATEKTLNYFPRSLGAIFENLKAIDTSYCKLKEIHQEDLKLFPKLIEFWSHGNSLEILEDGLLDFNPNLEFFSLEYNKIVHIGPNIFDHLSKLSSLNLGSNECISNSASRSIPTVKSIIQELKAECVNSEFSELNQKFVNFENSFKDLAEKFINFGETLKSSKFFNFRPISSKYSDLKNVLVEPKSCSLVISSSDPKVPQNLNPISIRLGYMTENGQCIAMDYSNTSSDLLAVQNVIKKAQANISQSQNYDRATICTFKDEIVTKLEEVNQKFLTDFESKIKIQLDDIKGSKYSEYEDLLKLKERLTKFEEKTDKKLQKIEMELENNRIRILSAMDAKVKASEKRLLGKIEDIFEEKLEKLVEKFEK